MSYDSYAGMRRLGGLDVFDMRGNGRGGFKFVIPGVMLGSDDVQVEFDREAKGWVLTYEDAGRTWTGRAENLTAAYLDLIADRCGLHEDD